MTEDPGKETRLVLLGDRQVVVKAPVDAQIMLLSQQGQIATNTRVSTQDRMKAVGMLMTIMTALIVQEDDRDYVRDLIAAGDLDLAALTTIVSAFHGDAPKKAAVRRGRAAAR